MSKEIKPQIYFLIRRGWHDQLLKLCDGVISKKGKDPLTTYWKAYSLGMIGNNVECFRLLESFQSRKDMLYPVSLALLFFHSRATVQDTDAIDALNSELAIAEDVTKEAGMVLAARFALFTGDHSLASRIAQRLLEGCRDDGPSTPFELEAQCVDHWVSVLSAQATFCEAQATGSRTNESEIKRKMQSIDNSSSSGNDQDVDSLMMRVKAKQATKQNGDALNILNQVIAVHPWFTPALAEKAMLLAGGGEWEQALDAAQRVLDLDSMNIDAVQIVAVHAFTQECQPHDTLQKLEDLDAALGTLEPNSMRGPLQSAALFSCICSRQQRALQICLRLLDRAYKHCCNSIEEAEVLMLTGKIHLMQGSTEFHSATKAYREASKRDPDNVLILEGMIAVQLEEGLIEDAESQIELLSVMQSAEELSPEFLYLRSQIARLSSRGDPRVHMACLIDCKDLYCRRASRSDTITPFRDFIIQSPDFLMVLAVEFLKQLEAPLPVSVLSAGKQDESSHVGGGTGTGTGGSDQQQGGEVSVPVQYGMDLLNKVLRLCPGMVCAYIELARCYTAQGMYDEGSRTLHQCLTLEPHCSAALVALSKVELSRHNTTAADRALEQALSCDFSIRSVALFRLVQATVRAQQGRADEAMSEMESVMQLHDIKYGSGPGSGGPQAPHVEVDAFRNDPRGKKGSKEPLPSSSSSGSVHSNSLRLTDDDRVMAFVVYASLLSRARRLKEANKVLAEAKVVFAGSKQEVQVLVAASHLAVERLDFDTAIRMLDKITADSPTYTKAQIIKGEILLVHNRDKEGFTNCYVQLVLKEGSSKNHALLGEAYLRILNPEAAVESLEEAYRLDPSNGRLRARIGRALVATHEYHRAVDFYEAAIREVTKGAPASSRSQGKTNDTSAARTKTSEAVSLSHDLARLYLKLGRPESSSRALQKVLHETYRDATDMRQDVATFLLLVQVERGNSPEEVLQTLLKARNVQKDLLSQVRSSVTVTSSNDAVEAERSALSDICEMVGLAYMDADVRIDAEASFKESILHNPHNVKAMLGLATLHRQVGELEACQQQCQKIISADSSNEMATIMLSEILFMAPEPDIEAAVRPLLLLLAEHPNNYKALSNTISFLRRAGRLEEVPVILQAAEDKDRRSKSHAGLHFCHGLHARFTNDIGKAILEFNLCRRDEVWGHDALVHMIELYLNPDQDGVWEEKETEQGALDEVTIAHIAAAETLLKELKPKAKDLMRFRVLESYCLLATRQKGNVDRAMQTFMELLEHDQDYLPAVLGMATGFMIEKAQHKARNLLKRVAKMELSRHDGEDFEKANLLLAKFYADKSKFDVAQELCQRCLANDNSCSQAWEILGLVKEKDMDYQHAAECYEKAWKLEFEASAAAGFKLAFCYLKCRKFVEAIDVCETVLELYPDYPRIREEILKKAILGVRSQNI